MHSYLLGKFKATTMKELNDKEKMELIGLIGNLKTHEMERKAREEMVPLKKKAIAFKCSSTFSDEDDEEEEMKISLFL